MPRSIQCRQSSRALVPPAAVRAAPRQRPNSATAWERPEPVRVIGQPIAVTLPNLSGLRPRYCSRTDEQPAAMLAKSMLRVGISRVADWTGSAVDFVAAGLARYCRVNGLPAVSRVFPEACIRLLDEIVERTEYERSQSEIAGPKSKMLLMVDYEQSAMIQIGPTLTYLGSIHEQLPAAFFVVVADNLWRWMRVYDFRNAQNYARDQLDMLDEEELKESFYPQLETVRPSCLKKLPSYGAAVRLVQKLSSQCRGSRAAELLRHCLAMHEHGKQYKCAWPYLLRDRLPEIEDYLENTDEPGPGSLIVFEEEDLIEACFSEEMQYIGQNYSIGSSLMLLINLDQDSASLDKNVKATFDYLGAMVRSLASASALIEKIRGIYDEDVRERRNKPGVQAQPSDAALRGE